MTIFQTIILGAVQGATEFIPVSSSAHILLFEKLLNVSSENQNLNTISIFLHSGTLIALLLYYRNRIKTLTLNSFDKDVEKRNKTRALIIKIILASIPIALIGFLFESKFDEFYGNTKNQDEALTIIAITLTVFGILFIFSEKLFAKSKGKIESLNYRNAIFVGLLQCFALIYGISRSGSMIIAGMFNGLSKEEALDFSFLVGIPVVGGATIYKTISLFSNANMNSNELITYLAGALTSFIVGYISISFLFKFIRTNNLKIFGIYRICLSIAIIILLII